MELTISRKLILMMAALLLLLVLFVGLKPILLPFILAALIAYLLNPAVSWLAARGIGRPMAVVLVFVLGSLLIALALLFILPLVFSQLISAIHRIPDYVGQLQAWLLPAIEARTGVALAGLPVAELQQLLKDNWQQAGGYLGGMLKAATSSTLALAVLLANLLLTPVVAFYLMRDWQRLTDALQGLLPRNDSRRVMTLVRECDEVLSAFIRGQLLVMLSLGVIYAVGLGLVGLELAVFLGLLAGLASVVPYLGFIVGVLAASIAAWLQFQGFMPVLWVLLVFAIGQVLESTVLTPWLVGDKIGLHPVAVIFAIMAGGQLAGFTGVLLALPVAAVLMVFVRHLYRHYKQSYLYLHVDE